MRYLLLLASMLVLCVAFGDAALPQVGKCTFRQAAAKERACYHTATQAFRKNPKANCGVHFNQMKDCIFVALYSCVRGSRTASQVREIVNKAYKSQSQYCDNAGIDIVTPLHKNVPCSSSYRTKQIACSSSLRAIWSRNRGDSRLCRKYSEAKKCTKALAATLCKLTGIKKELFDLSLDSYNPFCVSGKDPVDIPKLTTTKQPTTKGPTPTTSLPSIRVRLVVNGNASHRGRVEVLYRGQWGTICDDGFGLPDARVICRMLGYSGVNSFRCCSSYGRGSGQIWLDNLQCTGNETSIQQCTHRGWGTHDCFHSEDVGVDCNTSRVPTEAPITKAKISTPPVPNIFSTRRPTTLFMRPIRPSLLAEVVRIIKVLVDSFNRLLRIVEWAIRVGSSLARISSFKRDITSQMHRIDREVDRVPSFLSEEPGDDYTRNAKRDYINTRLRANKLLKLIEEAEAKRNDAKEYNIIGQSASFACYNLGHN